MRKLIFYLEKYPFAALGLFMLVAYLGFSLIPQPKFEYKRSVAFGKPDSAMVANKKRDSIQVAIESKKAQEAQEREDEAFYKTKAGRIHKKHPEWSREACQRVANKEIWIGMGLDMLKYERGLPDVANPSDYGNGIQWQWCWHEWTPSCFYDKDNDGHIDSYN